MAAKAPKIMEIWTKSPEKREEEALTLAVKEAKLSADGDLLQADKDLIDLQKKANQKQLAYDVEVSRIGENWSPANIVNSQLALDKANAKVKEMKSLVAKMKKLVAEYL